MNRIIKFTVNTPSKSTQEHAEEFCEDIDRRNIYTVTKEGLTLVKWDKMAKAGRIVSVEDPINVEPIIEPSNSPII